jgi:hypothetical protein
VTDFDSPWKEILETYFEPFIRLFFPEPHDTIDWKRPLEFLDKELQRISPDAEIGPRRVDKLVKVWLKNGHEAWILVHVEVQAQKESEFPFRMFVYHYRILDRYNRQVVSLAVLADDNKDWRPDQYTHELWGCEVRFRYPVVKLLDYQKDTRLLDSAKGNPFAVVVRAHLAALETRKNTQRRLQSKIYLVKSLYAEGCNKREIVNLFRFIDWVLDLPVRHQSLFWEELKKYEEDKKMPYVTSIERIGMEKGMERGMEQGLEQGLEQGMEQGMEKEAVKFLSRLIVKRFQVDPDFVPPIFSGLSTEEIEELGERFLEASSLDDIRAWAEEKRLAGGRR